MESITIDLQINITSSICNDQFNLLPTLRRFGLSIQENNWKTAAGNETIKIWLLNKNYTDAFNIKKGQIIAFYLLPYTNKRIFTDYEFNDEFPDNG